MPCPTLAAFRESRPSGALPWVLGTAPEPGDPQIAIDLADVIHVVIRYRTIGFLEQMLRSLAASIVAYRSPYKAQVACVADPRIAWGRFLDSAFMLPEARGLPPDGVGAWIEEISSMNGRLTLQGATLHPSVRRNRPFDGRPFIDQGPDFSDEVVCIIPDMARVEATGDMVNISEARARGVHLVVGVPMDSITQSMRDSQALIPAEISEDPAGGDGFILRAWQRTAHGRSLATAPAALDALLTAAGW